MEPKYNLVDATKEEQEAFMKEFQDLLTKHSMYYEPVPQFTRDAINTSWKIVCQIFLQKKVEVKDAPIPSPFKPDDTTPTN